MSTKPMLSVERGLILRIADHCKFWIAHPYLEAIADVEVELRAILDAQVPKCQQIQPDEAAMLNNGDYTPEELFGASGAKTCPGCEHCNVNKMFEAAYRAQATSPVFIVNDMLVKDANGEYFHLATRAAFKFFKLGRESWTN